jgi:hypothetical protein
MFESRKNAESHRNEAGRIGYGEPQSGRRRLRVEAEANYTYIENSYVVYDFSMRVIPRRPTLSS